MTARDELVSEIHEALHMELGMRYDKAKQAAEVCAHQLCYGPTPPGLLVRLAIERGALTQAGLSDTAKAVHLYRVVDQ